MTKNIKLFLSQVKLLTSSFSPKIIIGITGFLLIIIGLLFGNKLFANNSKIEVLQTPGNNLSANTTISTDKIIVDISGGVQTPGVYHLNSGSRIEDALIASGGLGEF